MDCCKRARGAGEAASGPDGTLGLAGRSGVPPSRVCSSPESGLRNGRTLRSPTGEVEVSELQNGSANVLISSERMNLLQKLLCKTHFEATVASFELGWKFGRKAK